ncbi:hypothetical protein [Myroides sp.]|uniref:hypothetical protein n=1 Tax=Myroides sp. TaxID=1874736 RepID=UPI003F3ADCB7
MDKIVDFIIDSVNVSRERLKMSIMTFYLALLGVYHWKVLAILFFSVTPMMERISAIDLLYRDWSICDYIFNCLIILIISFFCMILFPFIMLIAEKLLVKISVKRKQNKENEDEVDRKKELIDLKHKFELKQAETGNLEESEYLDKIVNLESSVSKYEKELSDERQKQVEAIENLKQNFSKVEANYKLQIDELKRQNIVVRSEEGKFPLLDVKFTPLLEEEMSNVHEVNYLLKYLNKEEEKIIRNILNPFKGDTFTRMLTFNKINVESNAFDKIIELLQNLRIIISTNYTSSVSEFVVSVDQKRLRKLVLDL